MFPNAVMLDPQDLERRAARDDRGAQRARVELDMKEDSTSAWSATASWAAPTPTPSRQVEPFLRRPLSAGAEDRLRAQCGTRQGLRRQVGIRIRRDRLAQAGRIARYRPDRYRQPQRHPRRNRHRRRQGRQDGDVREAARAATPPNRKPWSRPWKPPACANMVWYNYRRVPAVTLAKQLIDEGRLGRIFHYRAKFLQDWTISQRPAAGRRRPLASGRQRRRQRRDRRSAGALHRYRHVAERRHRRSHRHDRDLHQEPQAQPHRQGGAGRHRRCQRCSWRASRTARWPPSRPRATPAATRRSTRSKSTASTRPSSGTCTICTACNTSITAMKAACAAGGASTSPMATIPT